MINKPVPQPWYWATNKVRIRRGEFWAMGGLSHPRQFRRMVGKSWTYWREV